MKYTLNKNKNIKYTLNNNNNNIKNKIFVESIYSFL